MSVASLSARTSATSVTTLLDAHARQADRLIELLHELQDAVGYLRREDLLQVAHGMGLPAGRVLGVASFYPHFRLSVPSRHRCAVCVGTACSLHGAATTCTVLATRLAGVPAAHCTWDAVSCVGACGVAPVVVYDGVISARQTAREVLAQLEAWS